MSAQISAEYDSLVEGEEFEEVTGGGGDFPPVHNFNDDPELVGVYKGGKEVDTRNGLSTIHSFDVNGTEIQAWGSAVLNSRLEGLEGRKVKVVKTGKKLNTKSGNKANEFKVYVAKSAL